ncbi:hypothetical protein EYR40_001203 [Pleurotus pulmonarius]|nr:hypothetical protein EYR36_000454 [Pleurotus pulmonarius]KAF4604019.1 hypothetical protein EYR38_004441 [Pleurotus pulmonarius]KAF4608850.1 hypothetical protein EYR40_001203 [Pleurotus pulmonarius]
MQRMSTLQAFLPEKVATARNSNLTICSKAIVTQIQFSIEAGSIRASGVYYEASKLTRNTRNFVVNANREVILCAGAIASPQLLMLSGIGPRSHLQEHGITVVKNMPGVGSMLKDHASVPVMYRIPLDDSLHVLKNKPTRAISELLQYFIAGKGLFAVPFMQWSIFVRSSLLNADSEIVANTPSALDPTQPGNTPDIEVMPVPHRCTEGEKNDWDDIGVFSFLTCLVKPKSYGTVRLAYTDPRERASIDLGFLDNSDDLIVFRKAVRLALRLVKQMRSQGYPLEDLGVPASESDADVDDYIRSNIRTSYHYSCTCRMAPEDDERPGVVDDQLRVHGIKGLRVCDTSIFPEIVSTHTMAPAVMVAEKCADFIRMTWED